MILVKCWVSVNYVLNQDHNLFLTLPKCCECLNIIIKHFNNAGVVTNETMNRLQLLIIFYYWLISRFFSQLISFSFCLWNVIKWWNPTAKGDIFRCFVLFRPTVQHLKTSSFPNKSIHPSQLKSWRLKNWHKWLFDYQNCCRLVFCWLTNWLIN